MNIDDRLKDELSLIGLAAQSMKLKSAIEAAIKEFHYQTGMIAEITIQNTYGFPHDTLLRTDITVKATL
jgi:hypothetical protein